MEDENGKRRGKAKGKSKGKKNKPFFNPLPSLHYLSKRLKTIRRHG